VTSAVAVIANVLPLAQSLHVQNTMPQDATPFTFHEQSRVIDHFGEQLTAAGYAYYGSEPLYSGLSGTVMHADIFIGLVYYQRLRHMVSDKSQVCVPALHACAVYIYSAVYKLQSFACMRCVE
jgi:DNA-directed RNA polymerase beta subunit